MIKRILWCFQKFICKNEILWQPACVRLKTPNGLHFDPPWKRHFVHTWCFLFSSLPPSQCMLNALFSFDKTLCLVIITYLWSRFRNLTFCFWFVIIIIIYSSICFFISHHRVPYNAFLQQSILDFRAIRKEGKSNEIELLCQTLILSFVSARRCAKIFLYRN